MFSKRPEIGITIISQNLYELSRPLRTIYFKRPKKYNKPKEQLKAKIIKKANFIKNLLLIYLVYDKF